MMDVKWGGNIADILLGTRTAATNIDSDIYTSTLAIVTG